MINLLVRSQQFILAEKGLYSGPISGSWNTECQEAMDVWAQDPSFAPAQKPKTFFTPYHVLPAGFQWYTIEMQRTVVVDPKVVKVDFENIMQRLLKSCQTTVYQS